MQADYLLFLFVGCRRICLCFTLQVTVDKTNPKTRRYFSQRTKFKAVVDHIPSRRRERRGDVGPVSSFESYARSHRSSVPAGTGLHFGQDHTCMNGPQEPNRRVPRRCHGGRRSPAKTPLEPSKREVWVLCHEATSLMMMMNGRYAKEQLSGKVSSLLWLKKCRGERHKVRNDITTLLAVDVDVAPQGLRELPLRLCKDRSFRSCNCGDKATVCPSLSSATAVRLKVKQGLTRRTTRCCGQ